MAETPLTTSDGRLFTALGHPVGEPLGHGMEGTVYRLADGLVGKVWFHRTPESLRPLCEFYDELAARRLPFATPLVHELHELPAAHRGAGAAVTVERELSGETLLAAVETGRLSADAAQEATVEVVAALAEAAAGPAARALPVLDESRPLWEGHRTFGAALAGLVRRRAEAFHAVLSAAVPEFDALTDRVVDQLERLPAEPRARVVHGDVCPENILVDGAGRPAALLDWGFVSTAGDSAFDASLAAGFHDMYGPRARERDDALLARLERRLGHPRELLLLHRAAYAVAGANAYGADGRDGHFAWCAAALRRADVRAVLGVPGGA